MSGIKLSGRLQHIASFVPDSSCVADIGSDHGLLVCYLVAEGIAEMAIAGEIAEGPLCSTIEQVRACDLEEKISVRLGDGLAVIDESVDVVIIAGMGGDLIVKILTQGQAKLSGIKRLILQANVDEEKLRRWLYANSWVIVDEDIIKDKGHFYEIIVAEQMSVGGDRGSINLTLADEEFLMGPVNLMKQTPLFRAKWEWELTQREKILREMKKARFSVNNWRRYRDNKKEFRIISKMLRVRKS